MLRNVVFGFALLVALFLVFTGVLLLSGSYMTAGNFHDVFIPYLSATAVDHGLALHHDLHSPFGWIYSELNFFALRLIRHSLFTFNDLIPLTSLLWAICVVFVWFCALKWGGMTRPQPVVGQVCVAIFLALMVFNFRGDKRMSFFVNTWYGAYNNHLWGVIFLQLTLLCSYRANEVSLRGARILGVVQAALVYVCVHYKVSFGLGSVLLALVPVFFAWGRHLILSYLKFGLVVGIVLVGLTALSGYSYGGYLMDVAEAAGAKYQGAEQVSVNVVLLALLTALVGIFCVVRDGERVLASICQWCLVCLALYLCVAGDFASPVVNYGCALGLVALVAPGVLAPSAMTKFLAYGGCGSMVVLIAINLGSVLYIAAAKMQWVAPRVVEDFRVETPSGQMAWRTNGVRVFASEFDDFNESGVRTDSVGQRMLWAYPSINELKTRYVSATIADYMDGLRMVQDRLMARRPEERRSVTYLEFINPLPIIVGSDMVRGAPHWVHFGTTTPYAADNHVLRRMVMSSDEVVIPLASPDNWRQPFLNCKFLLWNEAERQGFVLTGTDSHHLYYQRRSGTARGLAHPMAVRAIENCRGVVDAGISGALVWPVW